MKIKCYIIDDEQFAIEFLSRFIERTPELELVGSETSPMDALAKLVNREIVTDIIFVDIEMPKLNGLDFAAQAGHLAKIVLVTGDATRSLQAYELGVVDYLVKPVTYIRFTTCINKVRELIRKDEIPLGIPTGRIALRHGLNNALIYLERKEIVYVEASSNYCIVYSEKENSIRTHISLSEMAMELGKGFMRVHRSFIVNPSKISKFYGNTIVLNKSTEVPLGKSYRDEFIKVMDVGGLG